MFVLQLLYSSGSQKVASTPNAWLILYMYLLVDWIHADNVNAPLVVTICSLLALGMSHGNFMCATNYIALEPSLALPFMGPRPPYGSIYYSEDPVNTPLLLD